MNEPDTYDYEERAAIMEYDGMLDRKTAEVQAWLSVRGKLWEAVNR